jgi:hypothetical protein
MKLLAILTTALALPGGSWSGPVTELEHTVESAGNSVTKLPGMRLNLGPKFSMIVKKISSYGKKNVHDSVKAIALYKDVELPLNKREVELWVSTDIPHFKDLNLKLKRILPVGTFEKYSSPDNSVARRNIDILAKYVEESKLDRLGRVSKSTFRDAKTALAQLISFQHEYDLERGVTTNNWEVPKFARKRLKKLLKEGLGQKSTAADIERNARVKKLAIIAGVGAVGGGGIAIATGKILHDQEKPLL